MAKQRIRAAAARLKEEKKAQEETAPSSTPKIVKGSSKRKTDGDNSRPPKKAAVGSGSEPPRRPSPKSTHGAGKGVMTSSGPVLQGPRCLLTHKDFAVEAVGSFIKPADIDPCDLLATDELGSSALFDLTRVSHLSWMFLLSLLLSFNMTDGCILLLGPGSCKGTSGQVRG